MDIGGYGSRIALACPGRREFWIRVLSIKLVKQQIQNIIPRSRGAMRPSFANTASPFPTIEGAGNAGRAMHPQPRVQVKKVHEHSHHGHTGTTRHSPRNGFTAYFALSPVTRLV
jgi:hypothetical protein